MSKIAKGRCFSDDLILEIFRRLPLKSLCRFKCASKFLRSSIEDPLFIKKPDVLMEWDVVCDKELEIYSIDQVGRATRIKKFVFPHNIGPSKHCNGLMWYIHSESELGLFNPTTGKLISLPSWAKNFEFGFDPISKKYKVLGWYRGRIWVNACQFGILRIEEEPSWVALNRRVGFTPLSNSSTCANGSLFWFDRLENYIISFNLGDEEFGKVDLPDKIDREKFKYTLFEFEGHLCLVERPNPKLMRCHLEIENMWMLKDVANSIWVLLIKNVQLPWDDTGLDYYYSDYEDAIAPVFGRNGEIMVLACAADEKETYIFAYSFLNRQFRKIKVVGQPYVKMELVKDHVENYLDVELFVQHQSKEKRTAPSCAVYACLPNPSST